MAQKQFKIGLSNTDKQNMAQDVYERLLALTFPEYDTTTEYEVGDFVVYNDQLYKCIGATSGAWDNTKWQLATLNDLLTDIENAVAFVNDKANVNGNYPTMTVGLADNLNTKIVQNEKEAYLFRTTGGSLEVGNNCKEKGIVGGSIGFNQLVQNGNFANTNNWNSTRIDFSVSNNVASLTPNAQSTSDNYVGQNMPMIISHKYLFIGQAKNHTADTYAFVLFYGAANNVTYIKSINADVWETKHAFFTCVSNTYNTVRMVNTSQDTTKVNQFKNLVLFDLTAMFGSTIADYIYSLEQAETGAGVAWFKRYFNKPYYPYTAIGGFAHVKTSGKKIVGFNQWDEEWEVGSINSANGNEEQDSNKIRSKNFNKCLPNTQYYLKGDSTPNGNMNVFWYDDNYNFIGISGNANRVHTSPANAYYFKLRSDNGYGTTYNNDICINFHYDGERDGEYEPYESETYSNDDVELMGIPQIDAQGNLYYEGDIYRPDGTVEKRFAMVDLGSLSWTQSQEYPNIYSATRPTGSKANDISLFSPNYKCNPLHQSLATLESGEIYFGGSNINVNSGSGNTPTGWLIYELATPTEDSATAYPENQPCNNWGTEERIDNREAPIPVGHDTDYPLDLKSKLEILPNLPSDDGVYVCKVESGTGEYVALGAWLSSNGYIKLTDITGYDAEKTQSLKNVNGVLTWVDDE